MEVDQKHVARQLHRNMSDAEKLLWRPPYHPGANDDQSHTNQNSRHLHAWRYQQGCVLPSAGPAASCQVPGEARDRLFMRVIGSPDPYAAHIDGMGGATSSTSKCVILSKSTQPEHDVDYLYGQVSIDSPFVDWSGNCGNLSTAAGAFAIHAGLVDPARIPENGTCTVRIWQANIQKTIIAHVPVS